MHQNYLPLLRNIPYLAIRKILTKIYSNSISIGQFCNVTVGATTHSKFGNFKKADVIRSQPVGNAHRFFDGKSLFRYEISWDGKYLDYRQNEMHRPRYPKLFESHKVAIRKRTAKNEQLVSSYDNSGLYCDDTIIVITYYEDITGSGAKINFGDFERITAPYPHLLYLTALLNSPVLTYIFRLEFATGGLQGSYSDVYPSQVRAFPIRRINFTTHPERREALAAKGRKLYARGINKGSQVEVLDLVKHHLLQKAEESDVVHDLLIFLAQQMIDSNKQKQVEQQRFFHSLEAILRIKPNNKGQTGIDVLTGKSKIWGYLGDYQKGKEQLSFSELKDILFKNKLRLGVSLKDPHLINSLRDEYEKSLAILQSLKSQLAQTDALINRVVHELYGLTEEQIAIVERTGDVSRARNNRLGSIAHEKDPRVMAAIIEMVAEHGPCSTLQLSSFFSERGISLEADKADTVQREFQFLQWIEPSTTTWHLTPSGKKLISQATSDPERFARQLIIAHEQRTSLISRLLAWMWVLNPSQQGAVIIPQPPLDSLSGTIASLRSWLVQELPRWNRELSKQMSGLSIDDSGQPLGQEITESIVRALATHWKKMKPHERRQRLRSYITERYTEFMFGHLLAPRDVEIWQARLDWAGVTHTAIELSGIAGRVWFPVGAFRTDGHREFTAVRGLMSDGKFFYRHTPSGSAFESRFSDTLFEGYQQQQRTRPVEYVALPAVRDWVCYRLRISHTIFQEYLQHLFSRALRGEAKYMLALEVDMTPQERQRYQQSRTRPVIIDGAPRYIIAMRTKRKE